MPESHPAAPVRRHLITIGAARYRNLPDAAYLPQVEADAATVAALFERFGYRRALAGLGEYATADHVRRVMSHWCQDAGIGDDDIVAVYYAGHGLVDDRHYLLCWDSTEADLAASALPTEDLVRILTRTGLRNLLLILDTCYGGAGSAEAARVALQTLSRRLTGDAAITGMWFLSSARSRDEAGDGTMVAALPAAVEAVTARTGQRQEFLDLHDLVAELNATFRQGDSPQRAELTSGLSTGVAPFLPNLGYRADLPPQGTDLEMQRLAAKRDLVEHFGPRSRGVDFESEQGTYFSGRDAALAQLITWFSTPGGDGKGRVVTGKPGCGKSSVLSRVVALSDRDYRAGLDVADVDPATVVPVGTVDVAVHARHKRQEELVARIASGLGVEADGTGELLRAISRRAQAGVKTVIVVDALDEAGSGTATDTGGRGEPRRIARELLRPLSEIHGVHLLVGSRRELVRSLGPAMRTIDLDDPDLLGPSDISRYVVKMLIAPDEPDLDTPYRDRPDLAEAVARAVGERAAGVYLVARMTARSLRLAAEPVDVSVPGWEGRLPSEIGEAFDDYLSRFGPDETRVRRLLTPLAFAEGQGLPRGLWPALATAVAGRECTEDDVDWLLVAAGAYIAEVVEHDRSVYRLYHQTLAEHLRQDPRRPAVQAQQRIVAALLAEVPWHDSGQPSWFETHPYLRLNLATHAAAAERIDELAHDPGFLLAADQSALLSALTLVHSDTARRIRTAYEQVAHRIDRGDLAQRAAYLQLSARRCEAGGLAEDIDRLGLALPWTTRWAEWSKTGAHRRLLGHEGWVTAVAVGELDGRPIAVSGDDRGSVRVWDLTINQQIGSPLEGGPEGTDGITAIALVEVDDYSLALLGTEDGTVRICDLSTGQEIPTTLRGHTNGVTSIAVGEIQERPVALTGSRDGSARLWDLRLWRQLGRPITGHHGGVQAVALADMPDWPVAITGGADGQVRIWDTTTAEQVGDPLSGHTSAILTIGLVRLDERIVLLTGSLDEAMVLWDLASGRQLGEPMPAHRGGVWSVAIDSDTVRPIAISGGNDGLVRLWDLRSRQQLDQPLTGHTDRVRAAAFGVVNGRPVAVTGGDDRTVRVWDLAADRPHGGHVRSVEAYALDADGVLPYLVTGSSDGSARVWSLHSGAEVGTPLTGHSKGVTAVAMAAGSGEPVLATGDGEGVIRVWVGDPPQEPRSPLVGHTNRVSSLRILRSGERRLLLSGSEDGTVRCWDLVTHAAAGPPLTGHNDDVDILVAGIVENRFVIMAGSALGRVSIWDLETREPLLLRSPKDRKSHTVALACLDGRPVALRQSPDHSLAGWDLLRDRPVTPVLRGHTGRVRSAVVDASCDQPIALTASYDGSARVWDLRDGVALTAPLRGNFLWHVALAQMNGRPVAMTADSTSARLWDVTSGTQIGDPLVEYYPGVRGLAVTVAGGTARLIVGLEDMLRVHDLAPEPTVTSRIPFASWVKCVAAATEADGTVLLLAACQDHTVRIVDLDRRQEIGQIFDPSSEPYGGVGTLATTRRDGRTIVITGSEVATPRVWDLATRSLLAELAGHTAEIIAVAVSDDGSLAVSGSHDATARLWRLDDFTPYGTALTGHDGRARAVAFARAGDRPVVVTGDDEGTLRCWDVETQQPVTHPLTGHALGITCLTTGSVGATDLLGVASADGTVRIWRLRDQTLLTELNLETYVSQIAIAPDGLLCVGTNSGLATFTLRI
ncbi:caspase family protein [Micromonospora sp. CA-246542]|uniref:caspase family protein n=1 Tax=Micromonospora sp. CA-246542 TaxID=3239959 RepID=UPI003D910593